MSKAQFPEGIQKWLIQKWVNGHQNFTHRFVKGASFKLTLPPSKPDSTSRYRATTANFMWLIQHAINNNLQLRAMGNGWSFSDVAVCNGGAVDTKSLTLSFALKDSFVAQEYLNKGKHGSDLFFVQAGMTILQIHEKLEASGRSLKACGASNGQSIAGATSTGTHGSAFKVGAVHDAIIGLHIITGPDRHVWLERASNPVASDEFIAWLGAEKISDDNMFNAAVIGFRNFGFIHGVMLETDPLFLLEEHRIGEVVYDDAMKQAINSLDLTTIAHLLPYAPGTPNKDLYHFELLINPHDFEENNPEKGIYLKLMYKIPYTPDYAKRELPTKGFVYGDNTLGVMQTILDALGGKITNTLVPGLVKAMLPLAFKPMPPAFGTIGETFGNTKFRGKAASAAIGIDVSNCSKVLEEIVKVNEQIAFPGALAFRFVKGTGALLGFTKFPLTCVLEMDGVDSALSRSFFQAVWDRLEALNIPYTLHWGKINHNLTPARVRNMYGDAVVDQWISCRHQLLDASVRNVFTNEFLSRVGLDA